MSLSDRLKLVLQGRSSGIMALMCIIPIAMGFDFGGVLSWTQYVAALAVSAIFAVSLSMSAIDGVTKTSRRSSTKSIQAIAWAPVILFTAWSLYLILQTIPLQREWLEALSPGAAVAWDQWLEPLQQLPGYSGSFPASISILPEKTLHAVGLYLLLAAVAFLAVSSAGHERAVVLGLLMLGLGTAAHSLYGIMQPTASNVHSFGGFVNRNNAALFSNLGLSAGLGIVAWRVMAAAQNSYFESPRDLLSIVEFARDPWIGVATLSIILNVLGIVVCGSRGGMLATFVGFTIATMIAVNSRRVRLTICAVLAPVTVALIVVAWPETDFGEINRIKTLEREDLTEAVTSEARFNHWQDSVTSIVQYLPMGSGAGSYPYAYLPYQSRGDYRWYRHADNIYLELLLEQGLGGVLFAVLLAAVAIWAIAKHSHSDAPFGRGLSFMGVFAFSTILVSQVFDFGLLLSANSFTAVILGSILTSQASLARNENASKRGPGFLQNRHHLPVSAMALIALFFSLKVLRADAQVESFIGSTSEVLATHRGDLEQLNLWDDTLKKQLDIQSSGELAILESQYRYQIARLTEIESLNCKTLTEYELALKATARGRRTLEEPNDFVRDLYLATLSGAITDLKTNPLSVEGRAMLVYTDFAHKQSSVSTQLIEQLASLQARDGRRLLFWATVASHRNNPNLVRSLCHQATELNGTLVAPALDLAIEVGIPDLSSVIGNNQYSIRQAAFEGLRRTESSNPNYQLLIQMLRSLLTQLDSSEGSIAQQALSNALAGSVQYRIGENDRAERAYLDAIALNPSNPDIRQGFVDNLISTNQLVKAQAVAEAAIRDFPGNERFQRDYRKINDRISSSTIE